MGEFMRLLLDIDWNAVGHRFQQLSWVQRINFFVLAWISITAFRASRLVILNKTWRRVYHFICGISTLVLIYITLLVAGAINRQSYARLTSSLFPILLFALGLPPLMHIWEQKDLNKALKKKIDDTPPKGLGNND